MTARRSPAAATRRWPQDKISQEESLYQQLRIAAAALEHFVA